MLRRYRRRYVAERIRHFAARTRDFAARTRDVVARTFAIKALHSLYETELLSDLWSRRWQRKLERNAQRKRRAFRSLRRRPPPPRKGGKGVKRATGSTYTRYWSKCTPTRASRARRWASWTRSWTTSSAVSPPSRRIWPSTASGLRSAVGRSRRRSVFCCRESWPSTPSARARRPSPSTPAPSRLIPL